MSEYIAVSACLLGAKTKYDGSDNYRDAIKSMTKGKTIVVICPEVFGGLKTPRIPAEIINKHVINENGEDMTAIFARGAENTLSFLKEIGCSEAILKDGSPSCGSTFIYDGTFTHHQINSKGITAKLLEKNGIKVVALK